MHFQISGDTFTQFARRRLLEDAPGHAWRFASCLGSDDSSQDASIADIALAILCGTKRLAGDETGMDVVDEDPEVTRQYQADVSALYAGRIRVRGQWYKPVAYVSNMGPRDMRNDHNKPVERRFGRGYTNRAWHYCDKDEIVIDEVFYKDPTDFYLQREVIFRLCGERPHWQDVPLNGQAALQEFLDAGGSLEERSHTKRYGVTAEEIWEGAPIQKPVDSSETERERRGRQQLGARVQHEKDEIKRGSVDAMNFRLNAELQLARELEEQKSEETDELDLAWNGSKDATRETQRQAHLADLRQKILAQAGDDLIELKWEAQYSEDSDETSTERKVRFPAGRVMLPRAPFLHWAFGRMKIFAAHLPSWQVVSPMNMKMTNDNPYHTDWVIGAGLDPENYRLIYYPGPIAEAALTLASKLQDQFHRPGVHVLVDGPHALGFVEHGKPNLPVSEGAIVVLPNLDPKYLVATAHAAAVITEAGGATCHLAQICRDRSLPIVLMPNALTTFAEGNQVVVDTSTRTVEGVS